MQDLRMPEGGSTLTSVLTGRGSSRGDGMANLAEPLNEPLNEPLVPCARDGAPSWAPPRSMAPPLRDADQLHDRLAHGHAHDLHHHRPDHYQGAQPPHVRCAASAATAATAASAERETGDRPTHRTHHAPHEPRAGGPGAQGVM